MERQSLGERRADTSGTTAATTTSAAVTMATVPSSSTSCTLAPFASLSIIPPDRQAVQVIQHAIHRPQSVAAQYLHQMYAAQQQHLMLRTAALQQHQHPPHLQSVATVQQTSVCHRQPPPSAPGSVQPAGVSQNSITAPASPATAQLISQCQTSNSSAASTTTTTISQQAMLLGNRPDHCNRAQMYLRTQMLILTPAATVAAVQSELPAVSSRSSLSTSSQVSNLALHAHFPGALAAAHSVILKPPVQPQASSPAASSSKALISSPKTNQSFDAPTEPGPLDVPQLAPGPQILTPSLCPVQTLVKQQLTRPPGQRLEHHQLFLQQQTTARTFSARQLQPIALRVASQEPNPGPVSLTAGRPTPSSAPSSTSTSSSVLASSPQTAAVQPQPPPLVAAPQRRTSLPQMQKHPPPPPPPLVLPRLPRNPSASLQRLSLHSVQALAVQSGRVMLTEQELPVAEALIQMPYQNLPPPQTAAVDLKVHPSRRREASPSEQTMKLKEDGGTTSPQMEKSQMVPTLPPKQDAAAVTTSSSSSSLTTSHSVVRSPHVEQPFQLSDPPTTTSSSSSSSNPSPPPPPILPSQRTSAPPSPDRIRPTHVLTHLIEGFVIREGLDSCSPGPSSVVADQQASLPKSQERPTNGDAAAEDAPPGADQSDSSACEMENNGPAADVADLGNTEAGVLQCEHCGKRGYTHTFVRSKRFCSMTCVRRFSVSCTRRLSVLRAGRWGRRPVGRRGRPPGRVNGASREHHLRWAHGSGVSPRILFREEQEEDEEEAEEDEPAVPMTTRLRKQAEREQDRANERRRREMISVSHGVEDVTGRLSQWNIEQVFDYITSLPGGRDVADEFRSQEIDGQALLLLTEDHLVSTMNLKLGPALKLCAHIRSLKDALN